MVNKSPPERREASFASRLVTKSIVSCHTDTSRLSGGDLFITARPRMRVAVSVRYWGGPNRKSIEKTRVGFGRTELSLRLSCTEFCALSSGHGPRGLGFQGGGVSCFSRGPKLGPYFLKKLGSDLVAQSAR